MSAILFILINHSIDHFPNIGNRSSTKGRHTETKTTERINIVASTAISDSIDLSFSSNRSYPDSIDLVFSTSECMQFHFTLFCFSFNSFVCSVFMINFNELNISNMFRFRDYMYSSLMEIYMSFNWRL